MLPRFLSFLAAVATIVAGFYAVVTYHLPNRAETGEREMRPGGSTAASSPAKPFRDISQESRGDNSPNIIGDNNVVRGR